jgi:outer membrane protein assembly factor BamB
MMAAGRLFKIAVAVTGIVVVLAGLAAVGYRVFRPRETLMRPTIPYPTTVPIITDDRPFSELRAAPLVVEGRLRVYAEKWRVWSDAPVGERYESTPYWAFRRWPAQVVGVVSMTTAVGPYVITQWSDGELVALDARRGEVAWRAQAPVAATTYNGRRTGATTVYEPRFLLTVRAGPVPVVIATGADELHAFDASTGEQLWQGRLPAGCEPSGWTGSGLLVVPDCTGMTLEFRSAADGSERGAWTAKGASPPAPGECALGRSECRLITQGTQTWLLGSNARLDALPPLEPGAALVGDTVFFQTPTGVAARKMTDGTPLWTWKGTSKLIAADAAGVYLLTEDRTVLGLSPTTGHLTVLGCASSMPNEAWKIGHIHTTNGSYIALERITDASPAAKDSLYFYGPRPVALVELYPPTKLPVWPGKFAACAPQSHE